jgi:hypothetical protein
VIPNFGPARAFVNIVEAEAHHALALLSLLQRPPTDGQEGSLLFERS